MNQYNNNLTYQSILNSYLKVAKKVQLLTIE